VDLLAQAIAEGAATLILVSLVFSPVTTSPALPALEWLLIGALAAHIVIIGVENFVASHGTRHRELAVAAILRGAFAPVFWAGAVACVLLAIASGIFHVAPLAAVLALAGTFAWEYVWVEAGQSVPLS